MEGSRQSPPTTFSRTRVRNELRSLSLPRPRLPVKGLTLRHRNSPPVDLYHSPFCSLTPPAPRFFVWTVQGAEIILLGCQCCPGLWKQDGALAHHTPPRVCCQSQLSTRAPRGSCKSRGVTLGRQRGHQHSTSCQLKHRTRHLEASQNSPRQHRE